MNSLPPPMQVWMKVYYKIGERELDMTAARSSAQLCLSPVLVVAQRMTAEFKRHNDNVARKKLLQDNLMEPVPATSIPAYDPSPYVFEKDDEEEEEDDEPATEEITYRHPGSPVGPDDDERWATVTTRASNQLLAIDLVGPNAECSLRPIYKNQISIRVDPQDSCLYYDCFSHVPTAINVEEELPKRRWVKALQDIWDPPEMRRQDSDDEDDQDDDVLDEPVVLREDTPDNRELVHLKAILGEFLNSKLYRIKLPLNDICGMALLVVRNGEQAVGDRSGVLVRVLELSKPVDDFAARIVGSRFASSNKFHKLESDWTPHQAASSATRHYIYGFIKELKALTAHMCHLSPRLASMFKASKKRKAGKTDETTPNSLAEASLLYTAAPEPASNESSQDSADVASPDEKLTTEGVNAMFVKQGLATRGEINGVNECLRAAVLQGHQTITADTTKDTVLFEGRCHGYCGKTISITWGQAMVQDTYAGLDYEDGGENAQVQCSDCGGNYLTGLCMGQPEFDCGKFHNHCTACPDFGQCIHDYRNAHCQNCGAHYFQGLSGFECQECGGGRADTLADTLTDFPPESTWDGQVRGSQVAMQRLMNSRVESAGAQLMMLGMMAMLNE